MKAIVQTGYGSPDVLEFRDIEKPVAKDDEVLIRVRAAALHAGDYFIMRGVPYVARLVVGLLKPRANYVVGLDVAGCVEAVGKNVARFRPGDEVFAACSPRSEGSGACAEYACSGEGNVVLKPANLTFEQAAALPVSGVAALHGLRDAGKVQPGQKVLINGASGGVGTFAVHIGKWLGAEMTGVCSTGNVDLVRSIGADHVIDYTREDFTRSGQRYDLVLDNVGNRTFADIKRSLAPDGVVLPNSGHAGMGYFVTAFLRSILTRRQGRPFASAPNREDLVLLKELAESGKLTPVIDRTYPLSETPRALGYVGEGHARGKVVITMQGGAPW
jgi:NADPH:quinone reductase-like Zn-dependent oxidoreductase